MNHFALVSMMTMSVLDKISRYKNLYTNKSTDFTRTQKLDFKHTILLMMGMQDRTLPKEIYDAGCDISTSGFVKRRDQIKTVAFSDLFHRTSAMIPYTSAKEKGLRLLAVDGTGFPLIAERNSKFNYTENNDITYRTAYVHLLYDLQGHIIRDAVIGTKRQDERSAFCLMIDRYDGPDALVIGDRGYPSYNVLEHIKRNPRLSFLFRTPNTNTFKEVENLPNEECDIDVTITVCSRSQQYCNLYGYRNVVGKSPFGKPKKRVKWDFDTKPSTLHYRACRFFLDTGELETIVTSLSRDEWSMKEIKDLYFKRWGIETANRQLKYDVGALSFHSRKDDAVIKELFIALLVFNIALFTAITTDIPSYPNRRYEYRISVAFTIHVCIRLFRKIFQGIPPDNPEYDILKHLIPVRPDRHGKRKVRTQEPRYFLYHAA